MKKPNTSKTRKYNRVTIVLDPATEKVGREMAKKDGRSFSKFLDRLVVNAKAA